MRQISLESLYNYLSELCDCGAFELHTTETPDGLQNTAIPYMMNDALECYLLLKNSRMTGHYLKDFTGKTSVGLIQNEARPALVFHQGNENVFTLWFETCYQILECYRYDQIGHFWVKGAEHWRRLVYIIGTIYDKYEYMGKQVCTEEELALLPLMEFAPFRWYSPIRESLDDHYPETSDGLQTMMALAKETDDWAYSALLQLYKLLPARFTISLLTKALNRPARNRLYELICQKITTAATAYPQRNYSEEQNKKIHEAREQVSSALQSHGFSGNYPLFSKETMQILAVEEHPFTVLDWDHFSFRIQFMVSEATAPSTQLNYGFFQKHGSSGRIETSLDFLGF